MMHFVQTISLDGKVQDHPVRSKFIGNGSLRPSLSLHIRPKNGINLSLT